GTQVVESLDAVQRLLEGDSDKGLHVGGGEAEADGLDLHPGRRELGERVHTHVLNLQRADDHHRQGGRGDQEPEPQARVDDPTHQRAALWHGHPPSTPYSLPSNSAAPTVTTAVPGTGPDSRRPRAPWIRTTATPFRP